jgi:hypothetical protein
MPLVQIRDEWQTQAGEMDLPTGNDPDGRSFLACAGAAAVDVRNALTNVAASTSPAELPYRKANESNTSLANKTVSSRELVDAAIARIEALDSKINAVVVRG